MTAARTTYARATAGYDEQHERELVENILEVILETSRVSDANVVALRTAESASALLSVLAIVLAMSPAATRSPTALRHLIDALGKSSAGRLPPRPTIRTWLISCAAFSAAPTWEATHDQRRPH